jgi:hypothetical protein
MRNLDPALEHHLLHVAKAQAEAEVEPHAVGDDLDRKAAGAIVKSGV